MEVREQFLVEAEPAEVAALLLEVETVASCVPGVEGVTQDDDGAYQATLAVRMGPIKARFAGALELDGSDAPRTLRARGKGRDRSTNSQVAVEMEATLLERGGRTEVTVVAQVSIRGRLGQFGTGVIQSTASEMTKAFATCLQARLHERSRATAAAAAPVSPAGEPAPAPASAGPSAPAQPSFLRIVARGLWSSFRDLLRRLFRRPDRR